MQCIALKWNTKCKGSPTSHKSIYLSAFNCGRKLNHSFKKTVPTGLLKLCDFTKIFFKKNNKKQGTQPTLQIYIAHVQYVSIFRGNTRSLFLWALDGAVELKHDMNLMAYFIFVIA